MKKRTFILLVILYPIYEVHKKLYAVKLNMVILLANLLINLLGPVLISLGLNKQV